VRAGDRTGREIERALLSAVARHEHIQLIQHLLVVDLLVEPSPAGRRCVGALALDHRRGVQVELRAPTTLLAAGGAGQVYLHTTNPTVATGDGIAMAYRAGARVANMEFVQFHPTALYPTEDPAFLISEAIRGEGALLRLQDGSLLMEDRDPMGSLASRDVVARAIHQEMGRRGQSHVLLDISPIPRATMEARFPGAVEGCRTRGIELFDTGIPVVPAAHYMCGGVVTDEMGRSSVEGLLASGEVAFTGVHGANRLASNSLLEAVVFSHRAAEAARSAAEALGGDMPPVPDQPLDSAQRSPGASPGPEASQAQKDRRRLVRTLMWNDVGIVRTDRGLSRAMDRLTELGAEEEDRWGREGWSLAGVELRNLLEVARLIAASALLRKESRGLHFNADHPERDDEHFLADTLLDPLDR
jgi:L-aspartate oxidase